MTSNTNNPTTTTTGSDDLSNNIRTAASCRFYESEFPEVDSYVMVRVKSVAEMGAYVSLLEYDNKEGMVLLSELSRKRIKSLNKVARVGKLECVVVLRVDKERGYIDLSKRRVNEDDQEKCIQKYQKSKAVHGIMLNCAQVLKIPIRECYERVGWPLYRKFGHAFDGLKLATENPDVVFDGVLDPSADLEDRKMKDTVMKVIMSRLKPKPSKVRADFELTNFSGEGIDGIKAALQAGLAASTTKDSVKINLVAPPLFVMQTTTTDVETGKENLTKCLNVIKETIAERGGVLQIKTAPRSVSAKDDQSLAALMEDLRVKNQEVAGDDDDEEEQIGM
uniref:S1 motif domain-containing protein n=2 Tax=Percolomonas cosmopolitus TaxID=63605 RepID=A0A7S1KMK2_9EUKA|eukprot:CAMPEP_0117451212 /NCGR_PEP_ID=MMETSP0759-20121206/8888_1 /TAXON_ID=63605 /ORGANISM="Percolomonas cosmopolitus, Strain WS" /LENGTH=334 /DNA_ID=CAMNT_0005243799 /DNA_START=30 /DNA_END=1034 /DNA_ORIENTATION=-